MIQTEVKALERIRDWLGSRCGIRFADYKRDMFQQRMWRIQQAHGLPDIATLARRLIEDKVSDLEFAVISAVAINHTYFFRETDILSRFRDDILPGLAGRDEIRIWSAACSTGEEVFTIAILIAEALGEETLKRTTILGTDISSSVIDRAEEGVFFERQIAQVPEAMRSRYLIPAGAGKYLISDKIRACCTFRRMNLKAMPYPFRNSFQIVFCRNVLYYFEPADQTAVLDAIHGVTEPGGWLITSVTESIRDLQTPWTFVANGVHQKVLA